MGSNIEIVGVTPEGYHVVTGIFKMFDTIGLPLDVIFELCKERQWMPSWKHFYDDAIQFGWKPKTILNRLETNIEATYGKDTANNVIKVLTKYAEVV